MPNSLADSVALASGYTASVLFRFGDPMAAVAPAYGNDGTDAANTFNRRAGDHHDAIQYFGLSAAIALLGTVGTAAANPPVDSSGGGGTPGGWLLIFIAAISRLSPCEPSFQFYCVSQAWRE
ncbi:MAG: hypothetical protein ACXW14_04740 [Burkholderiaceae bacterium]